MRTETVNLYEQVFESWLREQKIAFQSVVQTQRIETPAASIKNFDFLLWPDSPAPVLVELKGRTFHGSSLVALRGLDSWVTFEDVEALAYWRDRYVQATPQTRAVFVFVYQCVQVDIETDGWPVYDFGPRRFILLFAPLDDYRRRMKCRSPKWQTVMLPADDFRRVAKPIDELLKHDNESKMK